MLNLEAVIDKDLQNYSLSISDQSTPLISNDLVSTLIPYISICCQTACFEEVFVPAYLTPKIEKLKVLSENLDSKDLNSKFKFGIYLIEREIQIFKKILDEEESLNSQILFQGVA